MCLLGNASGEATCVLSQRRLYGLNIVAQRQKEEEMFNCEKTIGCRTKAILVLPFCSLVLGVVCFRPAPAQTFLLDRFDGGVGPNWLLQDFNVHFAEDGMPVLGESGEPIPRPWGPGVFDTSSGALNMRTTGLLAPRDPSDPEYEYSAFETGNMAALWLPSAADARFSNGIARSTLQINSRANAGALWLRGSLETSSVYVLGGGVRGDGSRGEFSVSVFDEGAPVRSQSIPGLAIAQGEEWNMEASAIGGFLSLKVWQSGEPEPLLPQLSVSDQTLPIGMFGLGAGLGALDAFTEPTGVNVSHDEVSFSPVDVPSFSNMVVFGDSLSDGGNVFARSPSVLGRAVPNSPPYFEGRLTNGPVWIERLADRLGIDRPTPSETGGTNYAWGSATTGTIRTTNGIDDMDIQLQVYFEDRTPSEDELFVLFGGPNDLNREQSPADAVEFLAKHVRDLATSGARTFLIPNLPAPLSESQQSFLKSHDEFNQLLAAELAGIREEFGVTIYEVDNEQIFSEIAATPQVFGLTNITSPACSDCGSGLGAGSQVVGNPDAYLFWDNVHYGAVGHRIMGDGAFLSFILPGDVNNSGRLDAKDLDAINAAIRQDNANGDFDMNLDGVVDEVDRSFWLTQYARTAEGDANLDGAIDFGDFLLVSQNFGREGGWAKGNFGTDSIVSFDDFLLLSHNYTDRAPSAAAVPEPKWSFLWCASFVVATIRLGSRARRAYVRIDFVERPEPTSPRR